MILIFFAFFYFVCKYLSRLILSKIRYAPESKNVFITGCDTGFGYGAALQLDKRGVKVFAGCLTEEGARNLKEHASDRLVSFVMDVTKDESVENAVNKLNKECPEGLWALINNAGVLRCGPLELSPLSDYEVSFGVNVMGLVRTSKAFLPLIRKTKGRIINVASVAGHIATAHSSAYCASKFAVQALSDAWRREEAMWGVGVVIVEPGVMKTNLFDESITKGDMSERIWSSLTPDQQERYGKEFFVKIKADTVGLIDRFAGDPQQVVDVLEQATLEKFPPHRFSVGQDAPFWLFCAKLPSWLADILLSFTPQPTPAVLQKKQKKE